MNDIVWLVISRQTKKVAQWQMQRLRGNGWTRWQIRVA